MDVVRIGQYPSIIQPRVTTLIAGDGKELQRLAAADVRANMPDISDSIQHFFSASATSDVAGYDRQGNLAVVITRQGPWVARKPVWVVAENCQPGIRMLFATPRAREVFIHHMQKIKNKISPNPTLELLLGTLVTELRTVDIHEDEE